MSVWKLVGAGRGMIKDTILIMYGKSEDNPQKQSEVAQHC
jgi:hypothetical protein